jgi:hypothetical protein
VSARTYRLSPVDRTGVLLGLDVAQVGVLGTTVVMGVLMLNFGAPIQLVAILATIGAALGFIRLEGRSVLELAPTLLRWITGRAEKTWLAELPLMGDVPELPPVLDGQVILAVDAATHGIRTGAGQVAVVHDEIGGTYAASVRVSGRQFALAESEEQDRLVQLWGDALAVFSRGRTAVANVRWSEWAAPAGVEEQYAYLADHGADDPDPVALASYRQLLGTAGPLATRHEVLVTLTVAAKSVNVAQRHHGDRSAAAVEVLLDELRLFIGRMESAGLTVSPPLSPSELAWVLRVRLDPSVIRTLQRRGRSLGQAAGVVSPGNAGPLAAKSSYWQWEVDGSVHRGYYVAEWPRLDVPAHWMHEVILYGGAVRTVAVFHEPVAPHRSQRDITRQAAKLESDEEHRRKTGFRVGAAHRRAARAVEEREEELVAGYGEVEYAGVVVVSAPDVDTLERACAAVVEVATRCKVELRLLNGRHDQALAACLPLARSLAPRTKVAG